MTEALNRCYSGFYGLRQTPTDVRAQRKRGASLILHQRYLAKPVTTDKFSPRHCAGIRELIPGSYNHLIAKFSDVNRINSKR